MAKINLNDLASLTNQTSAVATINDNNALIQDALENTLSRDGTTPNAMQANLDMNSFRILNLPEAITGGEPVTLAQVSETLPATIFVQTTAPDTDNPEGSLWLDSDSTDNDLYQLTDGAWVDTTINVRGATGATGATGPAGPIGGSTGATDNRLIRADGTGGATIQSSAITVDDSGNVSGVGTLASGAITSTGALSIGTSNAATVGTIELGHASDTTVSRDSAGIISVEGVALYSQIPQNSQSAAYTLVIGDAQKHILHPTADNNARTFTIPANASVAYPVGTCITFINQINTVTIAITSDTLTMAGSGSTGSRTLAANGLATAIKVASTSWVISGVGLS